MKPQELLATAEVPGQRGALELYRHDQAFIMRVRGTELMTSRVHGSEEILAELALAQISNQESPRVLVGGLGMGFTLAAVLGIVGKGAKVHVVELVPEVLEWNQKWIGAINDHPEADPRVSVEIADVVGYIRSVHGTYDTILLDVDNGPEGLTRSENDGLYDEAGLKAARAALRPGGVLAIWSSTDHPTFATRLRRVGFKVTEEHCRARRTKGPRRTIWLAERT